MCEGEGRCRRQRKIFYFSCFLQDLGLIAFTFPELGSEGLLSSKQLGETNTWNAKRERDGLGAGGVRESAGSHSMDPKEHKACWQDSFRYSHRTASQSAT